ASLCDLGRRSKGHGQRGERHASELGQWLAWPSKHWVWAPSRTRAAWWILPDPTDGDDQPVYAA
ncbi:MAG: hypothetical protein ABGY24_15090, partial [bacterium]